MVLSHWHCFRYVRIHPRGLVCKHVSYVLYSRWWTGHVSISCMAVSRPSCRLVFVDGWTWTPWTLLFRCHTYVPPSPSLFDSTNRWCSGLVRHIIFGFVWLFTHGTHHFWLLPNLTEDVSFFDSFKPSYSFEYCGDEEQTEEEEEKQEDEVEDETGEGEEQEKGTEKGDESESQLSEGRTGEESRTEDDTTDG